jgi:hypothetical protein
MMKCEAWLKMVQSGLPASCSRLDTRTSTRPYTCPAAVRSGQKLNFPKGRVADDNTFLRGCFAMSYFKRTVVRIVPGENRVNVFNCNLEI